MAIWDLNDTPPKTNMEPENGPLEKEIPVGNHQFSGSTLVFGGASLLQKETVVLCGSHLSLPFQELLDARGSVGG